MQCIRLLYCEYEPGLFGTPSICQLSPHASATSLILCVTCMLPVMDLSRIQACMSIDIISVRFQPSFFSNPPSLLVIAWRPRLKVSFLYHCVPTPVRTNDHSHFYSNALLMHAVALLPDLTMKSGKELKGRRGYGPLDYAIASKTDSSCMLAVTMYPPLDFLQRGRSERRTA